MTLDNLVGKGLERAPPSKQEISRYVAKIRRKIADCKHKTLSLDTRFDTAFAALLQIALAALRANGYRTTSAAGHQQTAIQLLPKTIGIERVEIRMLDEYRKKRSSGLYDASFEPSESEVEAVTESVESLLESLLTWLRRNHPERVA